MTEKEKEAFKIANNALYFDDSSDYQSALWEVMSILKPELFKNDETPDLKFIEDWFFTSYNSEYMDIKTSYIRRTLYAIIRLKKQRR